MRYGEGLMQVEMHDVEAQVARLHNAEDGVEVGTVTVDQPASIVHPLYHFLKVFIEEAEGIRVGQHQPHEARQY